LATKLEIIKRFERGQWYKNMYAAMIVNLLHFTASAMRKEM
jgi:hypothetical protein